LQIQHPFWCWFNVKLSLNSYYLCICLWKSWKRREFLIFLFTFDVFLLICFTNCFYRTLENYLNYIMNNEKIYVDNESSDICLIKNVWSRMTRSHYGSRSCRPLRELICLRKQYLKNFDSAINCLELKIISVKADCGTQASVLHRVKHFILKYNCVHCLFL
jgi:hypothetical protein